MHSHHADPRGRLPPERRADRRRGDAAPASASPRRTSARSTALARFLDLLDDAPRRRESRPALDPLVALVPAEAALARRLPAAPDELRRVRRGRRAGRRSRRGPAARVCAGARRRRRCGSRPRGSPAIERLLSTPLADAVAAAALGPRAHGGARGDHVVVRGARRLPAADAVGVRRELGDGFELDDDEGADRPRRGPPLPQRGGVLGARPSARRCRSGSSTRRRASSASTTATARSASAARRATASRSSTWRTSTCSRSTAGAGSGRSSCARWSSAARSPTVRWLLHTTNMHPLYRKFGFDEPDAKVMERPAPRESG